MQTEFSDDSFAGVLRVNLPEQQGGTFYRDQLPFPCLKRFSGRNFVCTPRPHGDTCSTVLITKDID